MCKTCDFIRTEPGTFVWSEESRRLFFRWQLWRQHGGEGPRGFEEITLFADLDNLSREIQARCQTPTLI